MIGVLNGGSEMRTKFSYEHEFYTPQTLLEYMNSSKDAYKEMRREYSKMRDISQKRLKRLGDSEFKRTQMYKKNVNKFKKLEDIKTKQELASRLSEMEHFLTSKTSTLKGQKEVRDKSLQTLHDHGYDFVNEENFFDYGDFMEEYRNQLLDMEYDSGDAAEAFDVIEKKKIALDVIKEAFNMYLEEKNKAVSAAELIIDERNELAKMRVTKSMRENPRELVDKLNDRVKKRKAKERKKKTKEIVGRLNRHERKRAGKAPAELKPIEKGGAKK